MATILKAGNVATGAQITSDATGILEIRTGTGAGTTAITVGTDQAVTMAGAVSSSSLTVNSNNISAVNSLGFRNRIINGAMVIDQRNAGASVTLDNTGWKFAVDRFGAYEDTDGVMTAEQVEDAPTGFYNSLKFTTTTADSSLAATQRVNVRQCIEGYNTADLAFGTAGASTITVSFWVKSSLTGTFGAVLINNNSTRTYPFSYTINSANTWEQKTITVSGDQSGTWLTTNGIGMQVMFSLGVGSTYRGTAGSWVSSEL
jgi:hypothetical protein